MQAGAVDRAALGVSGEPRGVLFVRVNVGPTLRLRNLG